MIRVLIVDDSPVAAALLQHLLESDPDIRVIGTAKTGREALSFISQKRPDVLTMDLHLPDMDGLEVTRQIMQNNPLPIVVVTATLPKHDVAGVFHAIDCGALSVIQKPKGINAAGHGRDVAKMLEAVKDAATVKVGYRTAGAW